MAAAASAASAAVERKAAGEPNGSRDHYQVLKASTLLLSCAGPRLIVSGTDHEKLRCLALSADAPRGFLRRRRLCGWTHLCFRRRLLR